MLQEHTSIQSPAICHSGIASLSCNEEGDDGGLIVSAFPNFGLKALGGYFCTASQIILLRAAQGQVFYSKWYKNMKRGRGRPRAYDPDAALDAALKAFWARGLSATSLDDISAATGMNRPSLYAAFGDKKSIYRKSLDRYNEQFLGRLEAALFAGSSLEDDLISFYSTALSVYRSGERRALGCAAICTATTEAASDDDIRSDLAKALDRIDLALMTRFQQAQARGQLGPSAAPEHLGRVAAAILHSLALRVRAGQEGLDPEAFIKTSVAEILKT